MQNHISNSVAVESLRWKMFDIPNVNGGQLCLVDVMGDDYAITQAARVSYGNDKKEFVRLKERHLIRYLMCHRHTTPFEMCELKFLVRVPMDCWRQWIRHRMANVNEYSTRYTEAMDLMQTTSIDKWRMQATNNKQGSSGEYLPVGDPNDDGESGYTGRYLSESEAKFHHYAKELYKDRLDAGVAKEQARKDLPLSTFTKAYWKIDLHNLLHFLGLRMDSHAQLEIRSYATIIGEQIIARLFPFVWEAFEDYRLHAMFLSALDQDVISELMAKASDGVCNMPIPSDEVYEYVDLPGGREGQECITKLERMGILS